MPHDDPTRDEPSRPILRPAARPVWRRIWILYTGFCLLILTAANLELGIMDYAAMIPGRDWTGHVVLIGLLAFVARRSFPQAWLRLGPMRIPKAPVVVGAFVLLEEFSQIWIDARTFSASDLQADLIGIVLFSFLAGFRLPPPDEAAQDDGEDEPDASDQAFASRATPSRICSSSRAP